MTEQEFQQEVQAVKTELQAIKKNTHLTVWRSFFTGLLSGFGSVVGVAIAVAILAWVLNTVGVIPRFKSQLNSWHQTIDSLSKIR